MEKANSTGRSFQEALTGLRATPIAEGMPLSAEILHGRSLVTRHPPKEPLQAHDVPSQPLEHIVMDHFYHSGRLYLIVCDYFSKFPFIF